MIGIATQRTGQVRRWTTAENEYVRAWWGKREVAHMAIDLDRTKKAVHERAYHLGIAQRLKAKHTPKQEHNRD